MTYYRSVCVFCGSSLGVHYAYEGAARALGVALAEANVRLVYGGGNEGMMGTLANAALDAGGTVVGVIPKFLAKKELAHRGVTEMHEVGTMHERKRLMLQMSDAFVALPGGLGTLDEFFEAWTWIQLGLLNKPLGLLNVERLFDPLLALTGTLVNQGFMKPAHHELLHVGSNPRQLLQNLLAQTSTLVGTSTQ